MNRSAAVPFLLERGSDVLSGGGMTTTRETVHGLLRLHHDTLTVQWRVGTTVEHVGMEMSTESDVGPVRETVVPLASISGAHMSAGWRSRLLAPRLVLTAADLTAFEALAGPDGLRLEHPAELVLPLRRADRLAGEEFCAELELALAERMVEGPTSTSRLPRPEKDSNGPAGTVD